jgi:hypothetical protein
MKKIFTLFALMVVFGAMSFGQNRWNFAGYFPDSTFAKKATGVHGLAVDPAGKIWVQWYGRTDSIFTGAPPTGYTGTLTIQVFNPDGTPAPFSPLKVLQGAGVTDTLFSSTAPSGAVAVTNRGLRRDHQGNILASIFDRVYRLNYQTGAVMNKVVSGAGASITAVGVDTLGEFFVQTVAPGNPVKIWASNFSSLGNVTDLGVGFCRATEVSKEGNDFYSLSYTFPGILRYHSDFGSFGPYICGPNDTLRRGIVCESAVWNPTRTRLWISSGYVGAAPASTYPHNTWYAWNTANNTFTDSLKWKFYNLDSAATRPRAIAFSNDGLTAYVGCFGAGTYPSLEKFTYGPSSVEPDPGVLPTAFTLSQNYPNPFNPSTEIKFTLTKSGFVTLNVYNMLGQEVATLVNESLGVGGYTTRLDASNLPSGTYLYRLTANGQSISKKMMLVK